jgi:hypothetical protein
MQVAVLGESGGFRGFGGAEEKAPERIVGEKK